MYPCNRNNRRVRVPILKATKGSPDEPEYKILHRIADDIAPIAQADIKRGITTFKKKINFKKIIAALKLGQDIDHLLPWTLFPAALKGVEKTILRGVKESGDASVKFFRRAVSNLIPPVENPLIRFDMENPRIATFIKRHTGELIMDLETTSKLAVKDTIASGFRTARSADDMASDIRQVIGLHPRQQRAVENFRIKQTERLIRQGVAEDVANDRIAPLVDKYADKQLSYRARVIAHTESIRAVNEGQLETWNQAKDMGLIDEEDVRKVFIVTPDDRLCEICAPMEGVKAKINEPFNTPIGPVMTPGLHPSCRCAMGLEYK